jgi:uncharacterized membrane protein
MATLTALKFNDPEGAQQMLKEVSALQNQKLITILDAAIVSWPQGKKKPKTRHLTDLAGAGALSGAFWGMLFGMIFFIPFFGMAVGAAMGALAGSFKNYGIDENFINQVREKVVEGSSALFLLTSDAVKDKVVDSLKGSEFEILASNLTKEQEEELQAAFGQE